MQKIFESETELGNCDADRVNGHFGDDPSGWIAFACTTAAVTSANGMLRVEQSCYLRSTERLDDVRSQNWVKPEITLEPMLGSRAETVAAIAELHNRFVEKALEEFISQSIVVPKGLCGV